MASLSQMIFVVTSNYIVTYDSYDANNEIANLFNEDQCWMIVIANKFEWMNTIAASNSTQTVKNFNTLIFSSIHDVRMNNTNNIMTFLNDSKNVAMIVSLIITIMLIISVVKSTLAAIEKIVLILNKKNIVIAFAFIQKNILITIFQMNARYFEYRSTHISFLFLLIDFFENDLYFTHFVISEQIFDSWFNETVNFLVQNSTEIVIVQIRSDEIDFSCAIAISVEIDIYVSNALNDFDLVRGAFSNMNSSIDTFRQKNKRLIVLIDVQQYSFYDENNSTLSNNTIVAEFAEFLFDINAEKKKHLACRLTMSSHIDQYHRSCCVRCDKC